MEIDYEKKYEEALAKARAGKTLEEIFPEMNESEDERIREWLVDYFKAVERACIHWDISPERIVAYLEKQKENPKTADSIPSNCVSDAKWASSVLTNAIVSLSDAVDYNCNEPFRYKQEIDDLKKLREEIEKQKSHLTVKGKGVYKICPRCKSRMIRDDSKVYTSMPPRYGYNCPKCGTMEFDTVMYDNPEMEEQKLEEWSEDIIRKAVKEVGLTQHQIDWFKTNVFPPKQEWSEEDERMRNQLIYDVEYQKKEGLISAKKNKATEALYNGIEKCYDEKIAWLKSLRPPLKDKEMKLKILKYLSTRCSSLEFEEVEDYLNNLRPSWKPSEEQMGALKEALETYKGFEEYDAMKSLYNELKKLM